MPPEGFADPIIGDETRFHLNMPASKLAEHVTQAIEEGGVNSTPPVAKTVDRVMHETRLTPTEPNGARGSGHPTPTWESNRPRRLWAGRTWANTLTARNTGVCGSRKEY